MAHQFAQPAADPIASHGSTDFFRSNEADACRLFIDGLEHADEHHLSMHRRPLCADAVELRRLGKACCFGKAQTRRAIRGIVRRVVANSRFWP
jgi:hypothetical protein